MSLTTPENQKNYENNKNKTSINFWECETELKKKYNILLNDSLFIIKTVIKEEKINIPKIEYEIYHPLYDTLNLELCKDKKVNITIPVSIFDDLDKYDFNSDYYNDVCSRTTSIYGTDISLNDRKNNFINNNMFLCEEDCILIDYDYINEKSKCSCNIKSYPSQIENIKFDKKKFFNKFKDIKSMANLNLMKCYKNIFKTDIIKRNYGFFIISFIIILFFICLIAFFFKLSPYLQYIDKNILIKRSKKKKKLNKNIEQNIEPKNLSIKIEKKECELINFPPIKRKIKRKKKLKSKLIKNIVLNNNEVNSKSNNKINQINITTLNHSKMPNSKNNSSKNKTTKYKYNDNELNLLSYKIAIKKDKRTYIQYYISLLKINHLFIFAFIYHNDYNLRIIKMFLFFFFFAVHFTVNALFFNDDTMHKIYEEEGAFNFFYQLPQIIYSSLISIIINSIVKFLGLNESEIIKLKHSKKKDFKLKKKNLLNRIKIKFILFFVLAFLFLLLFLFYISCFCGIYINTQIHLIKDSIISFALSLIYPFGICLLPGIFRICSLRKKDRIILFKISKVLQIFV